MKIEELLAGRTDLSTFLVHLTKATADLSAKDILKKIITDDTLIAGEPFGMAVKALSDKKLSTASQNVVCFTETPMEHLSLLATEIEGRSYKFAPYGIAITRKQARRQDVNPVWYIDITPGRDWLTTPINALVSAAVNNGNFDASEMARIAPFIEQMGVSGPGQKKKYRKEFWWEREWRHPGNLKLPDVYMVLCPHEDMDEMEEAFKATPGSKDRVVSFIDPSWSLEGIIGKLAGFRNSELGPF